ncbi:MAG: hypothetical protein CR997_10785 [Acidobacteria bacterium]|nr:MAG: hypothetical protein CR997_10785 [Acidobacteriota bacterium]
MNNDFGQIIEPTLIQHGFTQIKLESCIHEEQLWKKGRLWFGLSCDLRDQYLEVNLGHLYWFRDVIPRVIILGDYSSYVSFDPYEMFKSEGLAKTLKAINSSFDKSLEKYKLHYSEILRSKIEPKKSKYAKEFLLALGEEVKDQELEYIMQKEQG